MLQNFQFWTKLHCNNYKATLYFFEKNRKVINSFTTYKLQNYHLGQNKIGQQTLIPQNKDEAAQKPKTPIFHRWFWGEVVGGRV